MKEFVKKLIEKLEKEYEYQLKKADECEKKEAFEMISVSKSRRKNAQCFDAAIQIVKQLAEEYKEQNIDQDLMIVASLPSLYPMMQPFEVEAIDRVVSSAKHSGGWIPCSKELPVYLDNVLVCTENGGKTIAHLKHTPNEWRDMYMNKIDDVIAWQPLPVPFKE